MNRKTFTSEDRAIEQQVRESTRVSSYIDNIYDALKTGDMNSVKGMVPDYASPSPYKKGSGMELNETGGFSMDLSMFSAPEETGNEPNVPAENKKKASHKNPDTVVTANQFRAIKKYPQIVEFLGTENGNKLASKILGEVNTIIADKIEKNTQLVNEHAKNCIAHKQYLHQFFQGSGWGCKVTASGPFRGNEAFFFKEDEDKAFVLRRSGERYIDVSEDFNIVHDYRLSEE